VPFALKRDKHFVDMADVTPSSLSSFELPRVLGSEFLAPLSDGFIRDGDPTFGQEFFHFTEAEAESIVEPDGVTDNFGGKTKTAVPGCFGFHAAHSAKCELNCQYLVEGGATKVW